MSENPDGAEMSPEDFARTYNVSRETISRLQTYHDLLVKWQKAINLVSPKTIDNIWSRHFADSAQLSESIPQNSRVVDLGSGAGFPGLVLAVKRPELKVTLIESDNKKSEFLKNVSRETKSQAVVVNDRVENFLKQGGEAPDFITARAFAPLEKIIEMIPDNCRGAVLLLLKGKTAMDEIKDAANRFEFNYEDFASHTDSEARILRITFRN
jgi:16S rRNA (guanine527-N7)-methyltransferase